MKKSMKSTNASPGAIRQIDKLLEPLPDTAFINAPLEKLSLPEGLFDLKTPQPLAMVLESLLPIIVTKVENSGGYVIVDGCKRFLALKKTDVKECACMAFSKVLDLKKTGLLRIALNEERPMHIRERLCFYKWLSENYSGELRETLLREIGFLEFELKPLAGCAKDIIDAVAEDRIHIRNVEDFSLLEEKDRIMFLEMFRDLAMSQQTQRELLEWLPEIAFSRNMSVSDLLKSKEICGIMADKTLNAPQKIEAVRDLAHSWKYPLYSGALKNWKQTASATSRAIVENEPSSQVIFLPSPAFEKNRLEIRISISHAKAAKEIFERLSRIPQSTWAHLIYPVEDNNLTK
jgi:ParB-like nuclease domain